MSSKFPKCSKSSKVHILNGQDLMHKIVSVVGTVEVDFSFQSITYKTMMHSLCQHFDQERESEREK